jgi:hypothetical protein
MTVLTLTTGYKSVLFFMAVVVTWKLSVPGCGGLISLQVGGNHSNEKVTFTSPGYPEGYDHMLNCEWIFETLPGYRLGLVFHDMDLEESSSCYLDYVQVYKGKRQFQCFTVTLITSLTKQDTRTSKSLLVASSWFLYGIIFDPEDGGDTFLRKVS